MSGNRSVAGRPLAGVPELLEATIGNGLEGYTVVRLIEAGTLVWAFESGRPDESTETVVPDRRAWTRFAAECERLGVLSWLPRYEDPRVTDGTYWSFGCSWAGWSVRCCGANDYPPRFDEFCRALERLLDGRAFR